MPVAGSRAAVLKSRTTTAPAPSGIFPMLLHGTRNTRIRICVLVDIPMSPLTCSVCRKAMVTWWTCEICERAGLEIVACCAVCTRKHERNGRHRKEKRLQEAKAMVWTLRDVEGLERRFELFGRSSRRRDLMVTRSSLTAGSRGACRTDGVRRPSSALRSSREGHLRPLSGHAGQQRLARPSPNAATGTQCP